MRIAELLRQASRKLKNSGVAEHDIDARLLLEHCLGKTRTELYLDSDCLVSIESQQKYREFIDRRKKREPVAYILEEQEFWSLAFHVSPDVLIPRPETEFLLDRVLHLADPLNIKNGKILDLCCGSGVIATVLACELRQQIIASDISFEALEMTRKNSRRHELADFVTPVQSNLFSAFPAQKLFSLIVSNPPYVSSVDIDNALEPEVAYYEPRLALDGGVKGLEIIRQIWTALPNVLVPGGEFFMEIGADQGNDVRQLFESRNEEANANYLQVEILTDYTGRDRILRARIVD